MIKVRKQVINWKWLFAVIPVALYAINNRLSMQYFELRYDVVANFWDYVLISFSDVYLLLFYIFPLILFVSTVHINRTFDYTKLIRLGSYKKWIFTKLRQLMIIDINFLLFLIAALLLTAINTPFSMEWSNVGRINTSGNEILYYLQQYFSKPFLAFILQIILLLLTIVTFQIMFCILYARFQNVSLLYFINGFMYLYGAISFKLFPASIKFVSVQNYLSLFHGVASFDSIFIPFSVMFVALMILVFIANKIDQNYKQLKNLIKRYSPLFLYGFLCFMGILFNVSNNTEGELSVWDILIVTFSGTTNEMFSLVSFVYHVVVFMGFVYLFQLLLHKYLSEMSYYMLIRYKSMYRWFLSWFPKIIIGIWLLLLTLFSVTIFIAVLIGYELTVPQNLFKIIYHFMINGFLQLLFYVLFVITVSLFTKDVFKSFITLLALTVFMLPDFSLYNSIPVGLNSMAYMLEKTSVFLTSAKLFGYILIETIILLFLLNKRDYEI
ncbi:MAG: hypothetical protein QJR05_08615 [Thermoanaerobacterium sp.]|nr:hypothetical protein [Thermoanaerobacterium sp.]